MARALKESTELANGPMRNVVLVMVLLAIVVLKGRKVTDGIRRDKKSEERSCRGESVRK